MAAHRVLSTQGGEHTAQSHTHRLSLCGRVVLHVSVNSGGSVLLAPATRGESIQYLRLPDDALAQRQLIGLAIG